MRTMTGREPTTWDFVTSSFAGYDAVTTVLTFGGPAAANATSKTARALSIADRTADAGGLLNKANQLRNAP
jgi:hypothetical protein